MSWNTDVVIFSCQLNWFQTFLDILKFFLCFFPWGVENSVYWITGFRKIKNNTPVFAIFRCNKFYICDVHRIEDPYISIFLSYFNSFHTFLLIWVLLHHQEAWWDGEDCTPGYNHLCWRCIHPCNKQGYQTFEVHGVWLQNYQIQHWRVLYHSYFYDF